MCWGLFFQLPRCYVIYKMLLTVSLTKERFIVPTEQSHVHLKTDFKAILFILIRRAYDLCGTYM